MSLQKQIDELKQMITSLATVPKKARIGRPPGSKNKPKTAKTIKVKGKRGRKKRPFHTLSESTQKQYLYKKDLEARKAKALESGVPFERKGRKKSAPIKVAKVMEREPLMGGRSAWKYRDRQIVREGQKFRVDLFGVKASGDQTVLKSFYLPSQKALEIESFMATIRKCDHKINSFITEAMEAKAQRKHLAAV